MDMTFSAWEKVTRNQVVSIHNCMLNCTSEEAAVLWGKTEPQSSVLQSFVYFWEDTYEFSVLNM